MESHRSTYRAAQLIIELEKCDITMAHRLDSSCALAFCGTFEQSGEFINAVTRENAYRTRQLRRPAIPTVYYNWDLYPWQLNGPNPAWLRYAEDLRRATAILVPSNSVKLRTEEIIGIESRIVLSSCNAFEAAEPDDGEGKHDVVDVMRPYPGDSMTGAVARACRHLKIPCIETQANLPWEAFKSTIANARLLVSAYDEASTGGLTLLEGYRLGVPVLLSDSKYNGAKDYFGSRGNYFDGGSEPDLLNRISQLYHTPPIKELACRTWVDGNYSDSAFARRLANAFREVVDDLD